MPRDLADVLHYFLPTDPAAERLRNPGEEGETEAGRGRADRPAALAIVAIPIGDRDVVRAALAWNLAVEVARLGASASLLVPADSEMSPPWPEPGPGPVGAEVVVAAAGSLRDLSRTALDLAVTRAADAEEGVVLERVPPTWLPGASEGRALLRLVLLFASPEPGDLAHTYGLAKQVSDGSANSRIGITIHGARRVGEAEHAFHHLAGVARRHLDLGLVSYGLLVDDLHVYRAIVARRPIGLEHPQSRAARALRDVARLVLEDARKDAVV